MSERSITIFANEQTIVNARHQGVVDAEFNPEAFDELAQLASPDYRPASELTIVLGGARRHPFSDVQPDFHTFYRPLPMRDGRLAIGEIDEADDRIRGDMLPPATAVAKDFISWNSYAMSEALYDGMLPPPARRTILRAGLVESGAVAVAGICAVVEPRPLFATVGTAALGLIIGVTALAYGSPRHEQVELDRSQSLQLPTISDINRCLPICWWKIANASPGSNLRKTGGHCLRFRARRSLHDVISIASVNN